MTRILAVIDPRENNHHALERCREQPPENDLEIHAVLFIPHESAEKFSKTFAEKSGWLSAQVAPYIADGYRITSEVIPFDNLYESVIETATKFHADFVVKPMRQHSLFQTVVRTSTDWNLIRHCPFPMLLVSEQSEIKGKPVLAAVDVCSGDESHDELNDIVLRQAKRFSEVLGSELQLVNAWKTSTPMMAVGSVDSTPYPSPGDLQRQHNEAMKEMASAHNVTKTTVSEGAPAVVINQAASDAGAGVIVIGTVARKGLSGALIGNTAENVLESSGCDVMVVKLQA